VLEKKRRNGSWCPLIYSKFREITETTLEVSSFRTERFHANDVVCNTQFSHKFSFFRAPPFFQTRPHTWTSREQPESLQPCYPEPRNQPLIGVLHSNCQLNCPKVLNGRSAEVMSFFANLCKHLSTLLVHRRPNQFTQKLESHKAKRDNFHHTMPTFAILKTVRLNHISSDLRSLQLP